LPLPSPWKEFLAEIDSLLSEPLALHCIGGFVLVHFYGLPRATGDIDYYSAIPNHFNLQEIAGEGSPLHKKYKISLHHVAVTSLPEQNEKRLVEMAAGEFRHLRLFVPDPYDCILSKIDRGSTKDRDDAEYLFRNRELNIDTLRQRYFKELRNNLIGPLEKHDQTLKLWIDIFEAPTSTASSQSK
jgi:uncharacterized nucleotidyltransferase DUF6036